MFYIKLEDSMDLVITQREPLFRGENLNRKIIYLIPAKVGTIDVLSASVYLNYIRADGVADVIILERMEDMYNETYYQYTFPYLVSYKLTKFPGEVCSWLQFFAGSPSNPSTQKTGECVLQIQDSKNMDDYLCDHQLTAIYQMQKSIDGGGNINPDDPSNPGDGSDDAPDWEDMDGESNEDPTMPDWEEM